MNILSVKVKDKSRTKVKRTERYRVADMYENNYPNDFDNQNIVDGTAKEVRPEGGNFSGLNRRTYGSENYYNSYGQIGNTYADDNSADRSMGSSSGTTESSNETAGNSYGTAESSVKPESSYAYRYGNYNSTYQNGNSYGGNSYDGNNYGGSGYGNGNGSSAGYTMNQENQKDKKDRKTGNGYMKKALVAVSLGLFFGICAGLGFYAVESATGMLGKDADRKQAEIVTDKENAVHRTDEKPVIEETTKNQADKVTEIGQAGTVVMDVSDVAAEVMPAIVSINNTYTQRMSYFGRTLESESTSAGSGIIVGESDTELLIVSNYHVVQDADVLSVQFVDGSEAEAQLKGSDPEMDLAVIAVSLDGVEATTREVIAVAALGDSDSLIVGEPAIAIGNALGYGQSVTVGVISALDRVIDLSGTGEVTADGEDGESFIQTDAAINPGNSGGALLNMKGEVIGINSNKIGGSVVEGMGYAIPISAAKPIIEDLMLRETREKVSEDKKGYLGISQLTVVDEMAEVYGMPRGVFVSQVYEGTGAEAAGIVKGNIIVEFDGNKIKSSEDLLRVMEYYSVGDTVEVVLMQGSPDGWESKTVTVTLGGKFE